MNFGVLEDKARCFGPLCCLSFDRYVRAAILREGPNRLKNNLALFVRLILLRYLLGKCGNFASIKGRPNDV